MSVEVETRSRARSFRRGVRRLLSTNGPQRSSDAAALVSTPAAAPVQAMFQDARNTNIRRATFNIYGSGAPTGAPSSSGSTTLQQSASDSLIAGTSVPMNLMAISAGSVLPPDPIPTPLTSPETYVHHLITKNRGYPLWIPSPSMRLPACNRASGVRIGDVGIITPEGAFLFLFNVFHEATHPINASKRLPVDFVPFTRDSETNPCDIDEFKESSAGSYLADESLVRMDEGNDRLRTVLKTSAAHAAVLMMPEPMYASKLRNTVLLQSYVRSNIKSWYKFVRTVLGHEVNNGDLRVVYGCRKSAAFGIATVSNSTHRNGSASASGASWTELTFSIDDSWTEVTGCKYRWHHRGSAEVKAGPSLDENCDIQRGVTGASNLQPDPIINQCLFVSTIDFTLSEHEWQHVTCEDPVSLPSFQHPSMRSPSSVVSHPVPPCGCPSSFSHSTSSGFEPGEVTDLVSPQDTWNCDPHGKVELWPSIAKRSFHPSDILAQFLLRVVPYATSVALCSDDWGPYMTDSVQTFAGLIDNVLSANDICGNNGMVYLNPKSGAPSTGDSKLIIPFATMQLSPENRWQHIPDPLGLNGEQTWQALAQAVHDIVGLDTRLVEEQCVGCGMTLTKTPSPPCITIKLSDLMTIVDEVLPLAGLDQVLLTISPLWEFQIIFPRRRDEPHAVYGKGFEHANSALAENVCALINEVHIREERRALQQQGIAHIPSGTVSDCNLRKIANWLNMKVQCEPDLNDVKLTCWYPYDHNDELQQQQANDLASWINDPNDPASSTTIFDTSAASPLISESFGPIATHDSLPISPVSFATFHPLPRSTSPHSATPPLSFSVESSTSTGSRSPSMTTVTLNPRQRVSSHSTSISPSNMSALQPPSWATQLWNFADNNDANNLTIDTQLLPQSHERQRTLLHHHHQHRPSRPSTRYSPITSISSSWMSNDSGNSSGISSTATTIRERPISAGHVASDNSKRSRRSSEDRPMSTVDPVDPALEAGMGAVKMEGPPKSLLRPPKLAPSAWQLYFTDWIQKQQAAGTRKLNVAQAAKEAGQEYACLSAAEKEPYKQRSQIMKQVREKEHDAYMRTLTPQDIKRENAFRAAQRKAGKSRKSNIKDPNAPKKPLSAYFTFLQRIRSDPALVKDVFGDESETTKQSVLAACRWRAMTEAERRPFLAQAEQEKMEYEAARRTYEGTASSGNGETSGSLFNFSVLSDIPYLGFNLQSSQGSTLEHEQIQQRPQQYQSNFLSLDGRNLHEHGSYAAFTEQERLEYEAARRAYGSTASGSNGETSGTCETSINTSILPDNWYFAPDPQSPQDSTTGHQQMQQPQQNQSDFLSLDGQTLQENKSMSAAFSMTPSPNPFAIVKMESSERESERESRAFQDLDVL